jgi:hypothetical protein
MDSKEGELGRGTNPQNDSTASKQWIPRATRHELHLPLRYRLEGHRKWSSGEGINISKSGLLFSANEMLEVSAKLEIIFQASGVAVLSSGIRKALVVRRILSNWPETRVLFGVRFGD